MVSYYAYSSVHLNILLPNILLGKVLIFSAQLLGQWFDNTIKEMIGEKLLAFFSK